MTPLAPRPRLLIFDVDGTLSDSMALIVRCQQDAFRSQDLRPPEPVAIRGTVGLTLNVAIRELAPDASEEQRLRIEAAYRSSYGSARLEDHVGLYEGVRETLRAFEELGYWMAVATGKGRRGLDKFLRAMELDDVFLASRTADQTRGKPHPQMLEEILEETGVSSHEALMIGDTSFDIDMANAAGMRSVAVTYGGHDRERLEASNPTAFVDRFDSLLPLVNGDPA